MTWRKLPQVPLYMSLAQKQFFVSIKIFETVYDTRGGIYDLL
jgi:hypothetical protein